MNDCLDLFATIGGMRHAAESEIVKRFVINDCLRKVQMPTAKQTGDLENRLWHLVQGVVTKGPSLCVRSIFPGASDRRRSLSRNGNVLQAEDR